MKKTTTLRNYGTLLTALIAAFLVTACDPGSTTPSPKPAPAKGKPASHKDDGSTPPRVGMTKEQVRAKYGRPVSVSVSSRGECWAYAFNNFDGTEIIPFYGSVHAAFKKRNSSVIFFDANGRVRDFNWNEVDPGGGSVFR